MGLVSILKNWSNKLSGSYKEKRALRFESLEQRHLLSVSPLELPYCTEETTAYVGAELPAYDNHEVVFAQAAEAGPLMSNVNPTAYSVSSAAQLRDTINTVISDGEYTGITIQLAGNLAFDSMDINASALTDGVKLDLNGYTLSAGSGATVNITGVTFTSEKAYTWTNTNNKHVTIFDNAGELNLADCQFEGIKVSITGQTNTNSVNGSLYIISNSGDLTLDRVFIDGNSLDVINPRTNGSPYATANLYAINNIDGSCTLTNVMIYGNEVGATAKDGVTEEGYAIYSNNVLNVFNSTILQDVNNFREVWNGTEKSNIYNTIFTANVGNRNGWMAGNGDSYCNIAAAAGDLAEIFAYYNGGTFLNDGVKDYSLKDDAPVIDAGNSEQTGGTSLDILGNARVFGGLVDIGAVEYHIPACAVPTNVTAAPADGLAGLATFILTWDIMGDADGYDVRYYVGGSVEGLEDGDWTAVEPGDFVVDGDTMTFTLSGLAQRETVFFEVRSTSDDESLEASGWVQVSATTKMQLATPAAEVTGTGTVVLTWNADDFAGDVLLEYRVSGTGEWTFDAMLVCDAGYSVEDGVATAVITADLDEYTAYDFRITPISDAAGDVDAIPSGEVSATTLFQLDAPIFGVPAVDTTTITVSLTDAAKNTLYDGEYTILFECVDEFGVPVPAGDLDFDAGVLTASGLTQGVTYIFSAWASNESDTQLITSAEATVSAKTIVRLEELTLLGAKAVAGTTDRIELTWDATGFTGTVWLEYRVSETEVWGFTAELQSDGGVDDHVYTVDGGVATFVVGGLTEYTAYDFRVTAMGDEIEVFSSEASDMLTGTTLFQLDAPAFTGTPDVGTDTITVYLADALENADYDGFYQIVVECSTDSDFGSESEIFVSAADAGTLAALFTGLAQGETYYFRAMATNPADDADDYTIDSAWAAMDGSLTTFIDLADCEGLMDGVTAIGISTGTIEVTWGELPVGVKFDVEYLPANMDWNDDLDTQLGMVWKEDGSGVFITGLKEGTLFNIRVTATPDGDDSAYAGSQELGLSATTLVQLGAPLIDFNSGSSTAGSITMTLVDTYNANFDYPEAVAYYAVQYTTDPNAWHDDHWSESVIFDTLGGIENVELFSGYFISYATTTGTVDGLEQDTAYYFRVMAVGADGISVSSGWYTDMENTLATLIKLDAPQNLAAERPADRMESTTTLEISWDEVLNGATGYVLQYVMRDAPFTDADVLESEWHAVTETGLLDASHGSLTPGAYYLYRVKAVGNPVTHEESEWTTLETAVRTRQVLDAPSDWFPISVNPDEMQFYVDADFRMADEVTIRYREVDKETDEPLGDGTWTEIRFDELIEKVNEATGTVYYAYLGLPPGARFEFQAKVGSSNDDYIDSDWSLSEFESVKNLHDTPLNLTVGDKTVEGFKVYWDEVETATDYKVEYVLGNIDDLDSIADDAWTSVGTTANTWYVFTGLDEGAGYIVRVTATGNTKEYADSKPAYAAANTLESLLWGDEAVIEAVPHFETEFDTDKMTVTWSQADNATGYVVACYDMSGELVEERTFGDGTFAYTFEGLDENTSYRFTVKALGDGETYGESDILAVTAVTAKTLDQTEITVERTSTTLTVKWTAVPGAAGYRIACLLDGEVVESKNVAYDGTLSYTFGMDDELESDQAYTIRIIATGVGADATASSVTTEETSTLIKLNTDDVKLISGAAISSSEITLVFYDPNTYADVTGYTLKYAKENGSGEGYVQNAEMTRVADGDGSLVTVTITGLTPDTNYIFELNIHGVADVSEDTGFVKTFDAPVRTWALLDAPSGVEVVTEATTPDSVTLTWTEVTGADGRYLVQFSEAGEENWRDAGAAISVDGDTVTAIIAGLEYYTGYDFRVMSLGLAGESDDSPGYSDPVTTGTTLQCPLDQVDVTVTADSNSQITITWNDLVNDAAGDISYIVTVMQGDTLVGIYGADDFADGTTCVVDGLAPKTTYTVTVTAIPANEQFKASESEPADKATLGIPTGTSALTADFENEQVVIRWSEIPEAETYTLKYVTGETGEGEGTVLATFTADELVFGENGLTAFAWDGFAYSTTYWFFVEAAGPVATHDPTESNRDDVVTPVEIVLEGVIRKKGGQSSFTDTAMPENTVWVDEWTTVYLEVWASVGEEDSLAEGLVPGRMVTFTIDWTPDFDAYWDIQLMLYDGVSYTELPEGIQLSVENGVWTLLILPGYELPANAGAAMVAQFELVPVEKGGLPWEVMYTETAFRFNGDLLDTTVYAVPYDTNDNGVVEDMDYSGFSKYYDSYHPLADINGDGSVTNKGDWSWLLFDSENIGVSYLNPEYLNYYDGFPYDFIKGWKPGDPSPAEQVVVAGSMLRAPEIAAFTATAVVEDYTAMELVQSGAETYLGELPVVNDANAMSTNAVVMRVADKPVDDETEELVMHFAGENLEADPEEMM